ncbi:hypothetical protein [Aestuariibius sp. HNIBRBA575]
MYEATTHRRTRDAYQNAHALRGQVLSDFFAWVGRRRPKFSSFRWA